MSNIWLSIHLKFIVSEFIFKLLSAVCQSLLYHFGIPTKGFPRSSHGRESPCYVGDQGSVLMSGRSPGEGNGNTLQYSCLENSMGRGACWGHKELDVAEWLTLSLFHSAYKLNKQGDNIHPCHTPFPVLNHTAIPCQVLTVASWPEYRFLRRQVK